MQTDTLPLLGTLELHKYVGERQRTPGAQLEDEFQCKHCAKVGF